MSIETEDPVRLVVNPQDVRTRMDSIHARAGVIARTLNTPSAADSARRRAKDELVVLSKEALQLWALI